MYAYIHVYTIIVYISLLFMKYTSCVINKLLVYSNDNNDNN